MSIKKSYAVFGLGRYGSAVAKELVLNGADVLAVDSNENVVNSLSAELPLCKCADVTDAETLKRLGVSNFDVVVIAMASGLEASVISVMLCKEAGVETVIAKCANETHRSILYKVGADKVVLPESEAGTRLAKNLLSSGFIDAVELSEEVSIIEMDAKKEWIGKTLLELNLRKKYNLNVIAIRKGDGLQITVDPNEPIVSDEKLVILTTRQALRKFR